MTTQIRGSVSRWVKAQSCDTLKFFKENQKFVVLVSSCKKSGDLSVVIRCNACKKDIGLHRKNTSSPYVISNWIRHIKSCKKLTTKPASHQQPLEKFLTTTDTSSYLDSTYDCGQTSDMSLSSTAEGSLEVSSPTLPEKRGRENNSLTSDLLESFKPLVESSQVFQGAPPSEAIVPIEGGAHSKSVVDWSREGRRKKLLMKAGSDISQTFLTQYYNIVDEIERLTHNTKILSTLRRQESDESSVMSFSPVLKQIIANAEQNATALPHGKRHPEVIKKFATALFIYAGPLAYEFLQSNLHQALPSLRTIQYVVHANYNTIHEGEFRFDGLAAHIAKHNTTNLVTIGEDATRIICRVEYDSKTDRCVGFVLPLKNELPQIDLLIAISFDAIENMFANPTTSKYAYMYMAQPVDHNIPAYCLACFGTDNKFTAEHVLLRWQYIIKECERRRIWVVSLGGDGDSRLMKAMRISVGLFSKQIDSHLQEGLVSPLQTVSIPSAWSTWFWLHRPTSVAYTQDVVHIAVKLKSR